MCAILDAPSSLRWVVEYWSCPWGTCGSLWFTGDFSLCHWRVSTIHSVWTLEECKVCVFFYHFPLQNTSPFMLFFFSPFGNCLKTNRRWVNRDERGYWFTRSIPCSHRWARDPLGRACHRVWGLFLVMGAWGCHLHAQERDRQLDCPLLPPMVLCFYVFHLSELKEAQIFFVIVKTNRFASFFPPKEPGFLQSFFIAVSYSPTLQ